MGSYPYGAPTVQNGAITVKLMLAEPTRITRYLQDITLQKFIAPKIFAAGGGVSGGAVVYDQLTLNDLYTANDVQEVAPGAEFPIVGGTEDEPQVAKVRKQGGKFFITDEARDRNDLRQLQRKSQQLLNTSTRKIDRDAVAELTRVLSLPEFASQTIIGTNWNNVITAGVSQSTAAEWPAADFAAAQLVADTQELGVMFDRWLVNPHQLAQLRLVYGDRFEAILKSYDLEIESSNQIVPGTALVVETGKVGEMRIEKPLGTTTFREEQTERTWVQGSVRMVPVVTNPFSAIRVTGLGG